MSIFVAIFSAMPHIIEEPSFECSIIDGSLKSVLIICLPSVSNKIIFLQIIAIVCSDNHRIEQCYNNDLLCIFKQKNQMSIRENIA